MTTVGIVQARTRSTRLPRKVLLDLAGAPLIVRMLERVSRAGSLDALWLATSKDPSDDELAGMVAALGISVFRGSPEDVLSRFQAIAERTQADVVVRLTGDCPLHDPGIVDTAVHRFLDSGGALDYLSNTLAPTYPDGLDVEVLSRAALERTFREATLPLEREHVTPYISGSSRRAARGAFRLGHLRADADFSHLRWTVDEPQDLAFARAVFHALLPGRPDFGWMDVVALVTREPELLELNRHLTRNEKLLRELEQSRP